MENADGVELAVDTAGRFRLREPFFLFFAPPTDRKNDKNQRGT